MSFDTVISEVCASKLNGVQLKNEQKLAVESLLERKDVLAVLPTGFGKSLIFRVFVEVKELIMKRDVIVLVVVPLLSIQEDQISEAQSLGISCSALSSLKMAVDTEYPKLIFASAEEILNKRFQENLKKPKSSLNANLELIVIDESHTIETWTGARETKGRETRVFRAAYGELSILRSLCRQGTPVLALTGTADENTTKAIITKLVLREPTIIKISPNRTNLRFSVVKTKKGKMFSHLDWLIGLKREIKEKGDMMDKTIVFCNTMSDIACVINYLILKLGTATYCPQGSHSPNDCLLGIYHSSSWPKNKNRVKQSFKNNGKVRVAIASSALSMGVNFSDVRYICNWGPPRNILDFHQEAGRAGRDNLSSHVFLVYHGEQVSFCEDSVRDFLNAEGSSCLRIAAYKTLDNSIQSGSPGHQCCSFCTQLCNCKENCDYTPHYEVQPSEKEPTNLLMRPVTNSDKECIEEALKEVQQEFVAGIVLDKVSSHGFSNELINDVVENSNKLFTVHDIFETCPVFSLEHALKILHVIQEIFLDIPNFDESMEMLDLTISKKLSTQLSLNKMLEEVRFD